MRSASHKEPTWVEMIGFPASHSILHSTTQAPEYHARYHFSITRVSQKHNPSIIQVTPSVRSVAPLSQSRTTAIAITTRVHGTHLHIHHACRELYSRPALP
ncbi:hypothetical protein M758_1G157500 [Ceratodon purpureus]|nr:hypothetical protein M758_1G157500 [Ceratodon purpureus]